MIALVAFIDPAFFYPRLQTDPLNYWLKAQSLVDSGTTAARWGVNTAPFPYAAMPGILRVPALFLFHDFDHQLRAIQLANILIVGTVALLSAYIFSWSQPASRHAAVIALAFAFTLLSPVWIANVFLPLADAPYAAFSLGAIVVATRILCSHTPLSRQAGMIAAFCVLFGIAFSLRFTAPAILVFSAVLARGHWRRHVLPARTSLAIAGAMIIVLLALVQFNHQAIFGRYFTEPFFFLVRGEKSGMVLNLLGSALPSQIVPNFSTGFAHPPVRADYSASFSRSPADAAWLLLGLAVSAVMMMGAWASRRRFLPEIVYVLLPLPVLAAILPSTTRYVMTYQPFLWIFFFVGASLVATKFDLRRRLSKHRVVLLFGAVALGAGVLGLRVWRAVGTASERNFSLSLSQTPQYIGDVAHTFRALRTYLETLPRDSALLVGDHGVAGRWKAISGLDYYIPDSALTLVAQERPVYVLAECGTLEVCLGWKFYKEDIRERVTKFGGFEFDSVFAADAPRAKVQVYRLRAAGASPSAPEGRN